ncbi:hypothetical protein Tco_0148935 [Tanacetum coccineum]
MIPPVFLSFYNNPCLKDIQAFYAKELPISSPDPITPPAILTPSLVLPPYTIDLDISLFLKIYTKPKNANFVPQLRCHQKERQHPETPAITWMHPAIDADFTAALEAQT